MLLPPSTCPESYSQLLSRSYNLYTHALWRTFVLALSLSVVIFVPRLMNVYYGENIFLNNPWFSSTNLIMVFLYIGIFWFFSALLWRLHCVAIKKRESFKNDFQIARKKFPAIVGAAFLLSIIGSVAGSIAFGVYAIFVHFDLLFHSDLPSEVMTFLVLLLQVGVSMYVTLLFFFYMPLIVIEDDGVIFSLRQSARLVWGNAWGTLKFQLTPWLIYLLSIIIVKAVFNVDIHIYFIPENTSAIVPTLLHIFMLALFIPWAAASILMQLRDLELRRAGISINT